MKKPIISEPLENVELAQIKGSHILIVDDNEMNQAFAIGILEDAGLRIDIAGNGQLALKMVQHTQYDVVFMDMLMPVMDGLTATKEIRKFEHLNLLPIVAMTANIKQSDRDKCTKAGMNDYVSKPIDINELYAALVKWIKPKAKPEKRLYREEKLQSNPLEEHLPTEIKGLNVEMALNRIMYNKPLYLKMLKKFVLGQRCVGNQIREALINNIYSEAERLAHTVKGLLACIGASELQTQAAHLEVCAKNKESYGEINPLIEKFSEGLGTLILELESFLPHGYKQNSLNIVEQKKAVEIIKKIKNLLAEYDPEAENLFSEYAQLIEPFIPEYYNKIAELIQAFDFENALNELQFVLKENSIDAV